VKLSDEQQEVLDGVRSFKHPFILVRGQAGVGKSVVIREIQNAVPNTITVSSKGLAAANINGSTIHRTFGLPTGKVFDPSLTRLWSFRENSCMPHLKYFKSDHLRACQLLILDECFDIRCDVFDFIDRCLRIARKQPHTPFGGLHVLAVGDEGQSQPITAKDLPGLKKLGYKSPYGLYQSRSWWDGGVDQITKTYTLSKIFRQQDATDGLILARFRTGTQTDMDLERINRNVTFYPPAGCTILTPYVETARRKNELMLSTIKGVPFTFLAEKKGVFKKKDERSLPFPSELTLKVGCRVIIKQNDKRKICGIDQQIFNGDQGVFTGVDKHQRLMITLDRGVDVLVPRVRKHEGKKVKKNKEGEDELVEDKSNEFRQYPVKLGFAITISSSQGMTMNRVFLDLGKGLWDDAYGLFYVALSRVKSLDQLFLSRKITHEDNKVSPLIVPEKEEQWNLDAAS
jgi:hypothetical protein